MKFKERDRIAINNWTGTIVCVHEYSYCICRDDGVSGNGHVGCWDIEKISFEKKARLIDTPNKTKKDCIILEEAIEEAVKNGFDLEKINIYQELDGEYWEYKKTVSELYYTKKYYFIIFSLDFAKAFWGDRLMVQEDWDFDATNDLLPDYNWEYYLQQMVLEKEPLKYLEKFL